MKNTKNTKAVSLFLSVSLILSAAVLYYSMRTEKYERYISDFDFVNLEQADELIDWNQVGEVKL